MPFDKLFSPLDIGRLRIRNRLVMPPMVVGYAGPRGEVTERLLAYYEARARGGVGLIIVEASYVREDGKLVEGELGIYDDNLIPGLATLVDIIKVHGTCAAIQLVHGGIQAEVEQPVGPSAIGRKAIPPSRTPRELTMEEVEELIEAFASAALRAKKAGFDAVEIHGTHGYLIAQFLSPLTNKRTDKYGADRILFALEIVQRIKELCGKDYPVIFRLCADEFLNGGITISYAKQVAKRLVDAGVDAFDVTGGNYDTIDTIIPSYYCTDSEGWFFKLAKEIKKEVDVPVISGGLISDPQVAEEAIKKEYVDAVFIGRQLIADPEWPKKVMEGRIEDIRPCLACNEGCIGNRVFLGKPCWCTVNPLCGFEYRWPRDEDIPRARRKKKVLVIGGGPAGLEAARIAALRGHDVILIERNHTLGGTAKIAAVPKFKKRLSKLLKWYEAQLSKLNVRVLMGREADEKLITEERPEVVIIATGSEPLIPEIPGVENAVVADDVLLGKVKVGRKVVIIGAGLVGVEIAIHLAQQGKEVTIVELLPEIAPDLEPISKIALTKPSGILREYGIKVLTNTPVIEIRKEGVIVFRPPANKEMLVADTVILATGRKPVLDQRLLEITKRVAKEVYIIGDAKEPRKIIDAIHEGFFTALNIC